MKNFTKKSILQKTIIAILVALLLSNFIVPTYSQADAGGVLLSPIVDLLCSLGDAVINLLQVAMTGEAGSNGAMNWSLSAFLMESGKYYGSAKHVPATGGTTIKVDSTQFDKGWLGLKDEYYVPVATYSPEQIFAGKVAGLDINFINPNTYVKADGTEQESAAAKLQPTIATWYVALRNLVVVGLLSVLVYVGIRIIIASTASDKAKYKQMLMDWLVALCLVFFLHYIMSFTLTLTQSITEAIAGDGNSTVSVQDTGAAGGTKSFGTNLLGLARFQTQYKDFGPKMAYLIMYLALVIYTLVFTWFYLKRLLMMAFLTLVAPVVALTYPIDKISDGKAQAFDMWLKEYIFNALIQPFHLIIYTVVVGSAMDLAATNIIYMIAALAFIMPAEKILRKFFGFEKAGAGTLGALAGGAALGSMASKAIKSLGGGGGGSKKAPSGGESKPQAEKPPRFENKHDINEIVGPEGADVNNSNVVANKLGETETNNSQFEADSGNKDNGNEIWLPDSVKQEQQQEQARQARLAQEAERQAREAQEQQNNDKKKNTPFTNWTRAHNITPGNIAKGAGKRLIKGATGLAKFGTKTAFKAGVGTLAGAVAVASGGGLGGAMTAFMAGSSVGGSIGDAVVEAGGLVSRGVASGVGRTYGALSSYAQASTEEEGRKAAADALFGGTAIGRELDLAFGNTRYQDIGAARAFKNDKNNIQYLKDQMTAKNGYVPSAKELRKEMNDLDPYLAEGLTDIKDVLKAKKAKDYGISDKQAAIIAAIGKEKGITSEVLNDDKKFNAQRNNMIHEHMSKGKNQTEATRITDHTMNVLKVQQGVANNMKKPPKPKK